MQLALYQPEIPQNTGTLIRLTACLGVPLHIIEPCGFVWSDRHLKRAGMDYVDLAYITRHQDWSAFKQQHTQDNGRLILLDTKATTPYIDFSFHLTDTLLVGCESSGVPEAVMNQADSCVRIPLLPHRRSLNMAIAAAMVLGEALRQTHSFPKEET
ncbi:MAG: tRNA (cytidine(34)-2'-O)-methyltransferase [Alphaproteobacteria bacterium]